jgi:hypothetical protein
MPAPSPRQPGRPRRVWPAALAVSVLVSAAYTAAGAPAEQAVAQVQPAETKGTVDDLVVVDCLLPGQVRRLGQRMTYLSPRRPAKVTARECEIRGGEYVAVDRANYHTALAVWKQSAEQGDVAAQTYVGEIFEKGLGVPPDYAAAAEWYRRAAEKGSSRAAINLGMLYERGLGVPKDPRQALSWYRRGAGIPDLTFEPGPEVTALQQQLGEAQRQLKTKQEELERTQRELERVRRRLEQQRGDADAERSTLDRLRRELGEQRRRDEATTAGLRELERSIKQREDRLAAKDRQIVQQREQLARLEAESATLRAELLQTPKRPEVTALEQQLGAAQRQLKTKQEELEQAQQELETVRRRLEQQRSDAEAERDTLDRLRRELDEQRRRDAATTMGLRQLERSIKEREDRLAAADSQIARQKEQLARLEVESAIQIAEHKEQLARLEAESARQRAEHQRAPKSGTVGHDLPAGGALSFGSYHALVIGNNTYPLFPSKRQLRTAVNDANEVTRILVELYGFKVVKLLNATRKDILTTLNDLRARLTADDNLLIYYAGHGEYDQINKRGYWVPVDAEPNNSTNWIPTFSITDTVNVMTARQVLIVADSCYAGSLALRGAGAQLEPGMSEKDHIAVMQRMAQRPSRMLLASGGVEPVIDSRGGPHSVFSQFFIQALRDNAGVLAGREVFQFLSSPVTAEAQYAGSPQSPEYTPLPFAGHEGGDFFFVRIRTRT